MKNKTTKGSVLVFSLIMLSLILTSALAIAAATMIERKSSLTSNKSTQGFQVADSGVEIIAKKIKEASWSGGAISSLAGVTCSSNAITGYTDSPTNKNKYVVTFYDSTPTQLACSDPIYRIAKIKSVGSYGGTTRAVEAPIVSYQDRILSSAPVAYWKMDEASGVRVDSMGSNDGINVNAGYDSSSQKIGQGAGQFNGSSAYVGVADDDVLKPAKAVTAEAWVKITSSPTDYVRIIQKSPYITTNAGYQYMLLFAQADTVYFVVSTPAGERSSAQSVVLNVGVWYHVAGVYDGTRVKVYLNGVESINNYGSSSDMNTPVGNFHIGNDPNDPTCAGKSCFPGLIDEVAVYDRALPQSEIKSHLR